MERCGQETIIPSRRPSSLDPARTTYLITREGVGYLALELCNRGAREWWHFVVFICWAHGLMRSLGGSLRASIRYLH